jgi:hypothetical protein
VLQRRSSYFSSGENDTACDKFGIHVGEFVPT